MNLTKLFNGKYLMQNLKKSKGIIALLVLIIPVLTTLVIISQNSSTYECAIEESVLLSVNLIGMYIIPIVLSVVLAGYIYKRNSVDFINSMPMNRKTIYFTNFVAGILIILAIQILTLVVSLVCENMFTGLFLPKAMIWDYFVVMLFAYVFVYSATMLAQTVSGNVLTQIVVTALILFLVPFIHMTFTANDLFNGKLVEISANGNVIQMDVEVENQYTMPFRLVSAFFYGKTIMYNTMSIARMIVLSIVYLVVGIILFEKRKMENIGVSFASTKTHYIVKALTLVPMVFLSCIMGARGVYLGIVLTLIFVYYVLYDFIVSKKVKFKNTIIWFIVSVGVLAGVFYGIRYVTSAEIIRTISINDIEAVGIENMSDFIDENQLQALIQDQELIQKVLKNSYDRDKFYSNQSALMKENNFKYVMIKVRLKTGEEISSYVYMSRDVYDLAIEKMRESAEYNEMYKFEEMAISAKYKLLSSEETAKIKEILENRNYDLRVDLDNYTNPIKTSIYVYNNHELKESAIDIVIDEEIFDIVTKKVNKDCYNSFKDNNEIQKNYTTNIVRFSLNNSEFESSHNTIAVKGDLIDYIKNHYQDSCDYKKEYIEFHFYGMRDEVFITNYTEELKAIVEKEIEQEQWESDYEIVDSELVH